MNPTFCAARRDALRARLEAQGVDALLVSHAANRFYLSGFELHDPQCNESAGRLLVTARDGDWLLTDSRYLDAARRIWPEDRIFIYRQPVEQSLGAFLRDTCPGALGFEGKAMPFAEHQGLAKAMPRLMPLDGMVEKLRYVKDPGEIAAMRRACALNHKVFEQARELARPGITERAFAWEVEKLYRDQGASELSFATIAAVGPNGALPHAVPGDDLITDNCPLLLDKGCRLDEYCSDQTRTFWIGDRPTDVFQRALERTQEAQLRAIEVISPGVPIAEAYRAAHDVFARYGCAEHFTHALGHGIGLETHEGPSVSPQAKGDFEPGMVVTVEPGLYYPEWGGIRWEHMVLVTETGCEVF
ncbi:M24 family metallopeptidase [Desulfocurvus sp. DL9XJH121]